MKFPFLSRKERIKPTVLERTGQPIASDGRFGAIIDVGKARETSKRIEQETSAISGTLSIMSEINKLIESQNSVIESKVASALEQYDLSSPEPDGTAWIPLITKLADNIAPYIPSLMQRFGVNPIPSSPMQPPEPSPQTPLPEQPQNSAEQEDILIWIKRASEASPKVIKPLIPMLNARLQQEKIDPQEFKKAIQNLSKAYGE